MNILGINPGHNGSAALVSNGILKYYLEEDRLSRHKHDGNPFRAILDILSKWHVDEVVIGGTSPNLPKLPWTGEDPYTGLIRKFNPKIKVSNLGDEHHLGHAACALFNSGFKNALVFVVDGAGSVKKLKNPYVENLTGYEAETIWYGNLDADFPLQCLHGIYGDNPTYDNGRYGGLEIPELQFDTSVTLTKAYEAITEYLGFDIIEAGKTMGLSSYGKKDERIPPLFRRNRGSKDIFVPSYPKGSYLNISTFNASPIVEDAKEWHKNPALLSDFEKNLAWQIQQDTQKLLGNYIAWGVETTGVKKVALAGGYGLNCVSNYYLKKRFPDVEFYFEPIAHDGGTAIGLALLKSFLNDSENKKNIVPQTTLYHGPGYSRENLLQILNNRAEDFTTEEINYEKVAKLISEKNIVAIFQGRSEAGPRALGNRSILYDPRDPDGKEVVNKVKKREWFRPFAGSILKENANQYFDMAGLEESPFMMYAVNVLPEKIKEIPAISHVDNTCRIQTVTSEQNKHFYQLIKAFNQITGIPILFNTSFNLAGDPLVETLQDALDTLSRSELNYLYLPELSMLITKKTKF